MPTLPYREESDADERTKAAYEDIKAGFGAGQAPNIYKVLGNKPAILEAAIEHRHRIMDESELDARLTERRRWPWSTVGFLRCTLPWGAVRIETTWATTSPRT